MIADTGRRAAATENGESTEDRRERIPLTGTIRASTSCRRAIQRTITDRRYARR